MYSKNLYVNPGKCTHAHADNLMHAHNAAGPHIVCMRLPYTIAHTHIHANVYKVHSQRDNQRSISQVASGAGPCIGFQKQVKSICSILRYRLC